MLTSPRTLKYFEKSLTLSNLWKLHSHPYRWNSVERGPECVTERGPLNRWRLTVAMGLATTTSVALRAVLSLLGAESSALSRMHLSLLAIGLFLASAYQLINVSKHWDLTGFVTRYLVMAKTVEKGEG